MRIDTVVQSILLSRGSEKFVQKVKHVDEVPESKLVFPAVMQLKYDGVFCAFIVNGAGECKAYSRTGKHFVGLQKLEGAFAKLHSGVYIAEVVNEFMSLEELSGCINPNRVEALDAERRCKIDCSYACVHDFLSLSEFNCGYSPFVYKMRLLTATEFMKGFPSELGYAMLAYECDSLESFESFAGSLITQGCEGAVLKLNCDYEAGHKGYRMTKIVRGIHVDLKCQGVWYGKGKRAGQIATLSFRYKGKDFKADLGKGWTDEKRVALTLAFEQKTEDNPIGKVFHVKGLQESSKGVIRLPKVQEQRIDKDTPD